MDENAVINLLNELEIPFQYISHPEVKTVAEHARFAVQFPAQLLKNLLLKNSSGKHFYLYILDGNKKADLRGLALQLKETRLSFASADELMNTLGVEPGVVTPFAIANNIKKDIQIAIDPSVSAMQLLGFHPLINTASVCITKKDLFRFLSYHGYFAVECQADGIIELLRHVVDVMD